MVDVNLSRDDFDKTKEPNLESEQAVNKALVKRLVGNKCPKCKNNLEKVNENNEEVDHPKFGYFSYWKCPVCGWSTREKELKEE
jgi:uncharacterized protein with PIN domain